VSVEEYEGLMDLKEYKDGYATVFSCRALPRYSAPLEPIPLA